MTMVPYTDKKTLQCQAEGQVMYLDNPNLHFWNKAFSVQLWIPKALLTLNRARATYTPAQKMSI